MDVQERYQLTRREMEVVRHICDGLANKDIANALRISEHTVKDHVKNILRKMKVFSRLQIAAALLPGN